MLQEDKKRLGKRQEDNGVQNNSKQKRTNTPNTYKGQEGQGADPQGLTMISECWEIKMHMNALDLHARPTDAYNNSFTH